jgi:hypothetical protein
VRVELDGDEQEKNTMILADDKREHKARVFIG